MTVRNDGSRNDGGQNDGGRGGQGSDRLAHTVSQAPWDPYHEEPLTRRQEAYYLASQWRIMWWKLRRHRLAVISGAFLLALYISAVFVEILAPYNAQTRRTDFIYAPPQEIHLFHEGRWVGPFVYGYDRTLNMETLQREYTPNEERVEPLRFFCAGDPYRFWGMVEMRFHLLCPAEGGQFFLLGTDRLGRDIFSRIIYGVRISLTVGLIGVTLSLTLSLIVGGLAGYYGGVIDNVVNRVIEIFQSFPQLPLWMALSAAIPPTVGDVTRFLGITIVLALVDWTGLARAVRSKLLALREEDFTVAAQLMGASPGRIIRRHLVPGFASHVIASTTISMGGMILAETALSFLGLGLREPTVSWGVLLHDALDIPEIWPNPWILWPMAPVIMVVLAFQFFGDGLRDAADPYK